MKDVISQANKLRPIIVQACQSLDDKTASEVPTLFDKPLYDGALVKVGTKINWNGILKRASVDLYDTLENNPDNAPDLWEDIMYKDGIRIIPNQITVGLSFGKNERGWWNGAIYKSLIDNNVWTPDELPEKWEKEEDK